MALRSERLVGRAGELTSLNRALAELERRRPGVLALLGEPGIGKTRLLSELGERGDQRGHVVLSGSASELERELPFGLFVDALDDYVLALEPRRLDALDDDTRAELANVLPSLPDAAGGTAAPQRDERFRTHRAVRRLLEALAATKPLVLLLDDLHWADSGSIELLGSLLRRPPAAPVLLALALRPRQAPDRLAGALERAGRAGLATTLELAALTVAEARELVGGAVADDLYEESGGNPFYLQQLARSPLSHGASERPATAVAGVAVPRAVAAALAEELAGLSAADRRALEGAAVAGDPFELELAAVAAQLPEADVPAALDELLRCDLIRSTEVPRRFRFRHPLVRGAVYESAPAGWRLGAHERCAAALAARGAPAVERVHHVERCAREGAPPRSRCCARRPRRRRGARRRSRRGCTRRPCGCSDRRPRPSTARRCCPRWPRRTPPQGRWPTRTRRRSRRSRCCRTTRARCGCG
jgi:predicted ATPase